MVELELDERFAPDTDFEAAWRAGIAAIAGAANGSTARPQQR
jgi:hypothetical protein